MLYILIPTAIACVVILTAITGIGGGVLALIVALVVTGLAFALKSRQTTVPTARPAEPQGETVKAPAAPGTANRRVGQS